MATSGVVELYYSVLAWTEEMAETSWVAHSEITECSPFIQ